MTKHSCFLFATAMQMSCGLSTPDAGMVPTSSAQSSTAASKTGNAAGASAAGDANATSAPAVLPSDTPVAQQALYIGRFANDTKAGHMQFAWSDSAVDVAFTGTGLQAMLGDANVVYNGNDVSHNVFDITVDGNWLQALTLATGVAMTDLATDLAPGTHRLRLTKRTESLVGTALLGGFFPTNGNLMTPPAAAATSMVFYGVSNETGYGDLASVTADDMCTFSASTQDSDKAYPAIAAASMGMDLVNIAYAGKGIINNAYPLYDPNPLPVLYDQIDPNDPSLTFDFSTAPQPQVVGVDLGGNDLDAGIPDENTFVQAYQQFLTTLRQRYPQAPIVCVMGPMMTGDARTDMSAWINAAIQARAQAGDNNISFLPFDVYNGTTYGCSYHPGADLQASMATVFEQQLRTVMQ